MKTIILTIEGMKCQGCLNRIKNVLENTKGITSYDTSLEEKKLTLVVKKEKVIEVVIKKIENMDFQVIR